MTQQSEDLQQYLTPTELIDSDHPQIIEYAETVVKDSVSEEEKAIRLYYAVRDDIFYDPYHFELTPEYMRASATLLRKKGFCVPKATLLAAVGRAVGIPSLVGYADVRNHITTEKLDELLGTDLFIYHGYTAFFLNNQWVKATPAFNLSLCEKFHIKPLEFDSKADSLFHEFDAKGNKHMEYVNDRGQFHEVPLQEIKDAFEEMYPRWMATVSINPAADFEKEAVPLKG